jgi:hypothetical protein
MNGDEQLIGLNEVFSTETHTVLCEDGCWDALCLAIVLAGRRLCR